MEPTHLAPNQPPSANPQKWHDQALFVATTATVLLLRVHSLSEPLDCDEAAYGYVAHRLLLGDRLYADVFENKPPIAYAPYAAAILFGGYNEQAIRMLPVPFVVITLWMLQLYARRQAGLIAAAVTAILYAVASSDPFTFANGANLEIYINACLVSALYSITRATDSPGKMRWALLAGLTAGCAAGLKQIAVLFLPVFVVVLWVGRAQMG